MQNLVHSQDAARTVWKNSLMQMIENHYRRRVARRRRLLSSSPENRVSLKTRPLFFFSGVGAKCAVMKENFSLRPEKLRFASRRGPPRHAWNIKQLRALQPAQP